MTIGVAILGAGIFAKGEHIPAIQACDRFTLKAPDAYFDNDPSNPDRTLAALLARADVHAVFVALPIVHQPAAVKQALAAGKHVLSEKPIAKDTATAQDLIAWHAQLSSSGPSPAPLWAVGENYRFLDAATYAAARLREMGGDVVTYGFEMFKLVRPDDKYFNTAWRKVPDYQGGFLLDGGVHFIAGLRCALAAVGEEIGQVSACTSLLQERLAPVDTVHGVLATRSGRAGTFVCSFGAEFKAGFAIEVVTTNGAVRFSPREVTVTTRGADGARMDEVHSFESSGTGVKAEAVTFAESIEAGRIDSRLSPQEALKDLRIVQALLESGRVWARVPPQHRLHDHEPRRRRRPTLVYQDPTEGQPGRERVRKTRIKERAGASAKKSGLKIKIELDLEVELNLYARVKGDVTISLIT
ncbi:unnamed protein product [Parascedosporium putredinis]|uniref:NAD(P)-binding protein n=1 Tax=Parascedosporium putredinis TaxID=1442378 RepID=A0A9P1MA02_9PEZI|nr:unnamed protein product [Parascedosporium putredinis]CAI7991812.1 unnamed protein product [Parascedosporium putredinis]